MPKHTIYLHIGTAKTGTSSIQEFISKNESVLANMGYYYPKTGNVHNCHHGIAFYWEDNPSFKKLFNIKSNQLQLLKEELLKNKNKNIVISSECLLLHSVKMDELFEVFPHTNVKVIVYFRRQDQLISSRYKELIIGNNTYLPAEIWLNENFYPNEYLNILTRMQEFVPKQNIIVRVYEKNQWVEHSLQKDFCTAIDIKSFDDFEFSQQKINQGFDRNIIEYNRLVNTVFNSMEKPYVLKDILNEYVANNSTDDRSINVFSPSIQYQILEKCARTNQSIALKFRKSANKTLFENHSINEKWTDFKGLSQEKIDEISSFINCKNPKLVEEMLQKLKSLNSPDIYQTEAQQKLIPALKKLIQN